MPSPVSFTSITTYSPGGTSASRVRAARRERAHGEGDLEHAPVRHGVDGVRREVHDELVQARGVAHHHRLLPGQLQAQVEVRRRGAAQQVEDLGGHRPQRHRRLHAALGAAVGEDLLDERLGAVAGAHDRVDVALELRVALDARLRELAVAQDRAQDVVEVVRDPAREAPHRLHLLRLPELGGERLPLGLRAHPLGDVAHEADDPPPPLPEARGILDRIPVDADRDPFALGALHAVLDGDVGDLARHELLADAADALAVVGVHALAPCLHGRDGLGRHAQHRARVAVPEDPPRDGVELVEEVAARADGRLVAAAPGLRRLRGRLALGQQRARRRAWSPRPWRGSPAAAAASARRCRRWRRARGRWPCASSRSARTPRARRRRCAGRTAGPPR